MMWVVLRGRERMVEGEVKERVEGVEGVEGGGRERTGEERVEGRVGQGVEQRERERVGGRGVGRTSWWAEDGEDGVSVIWVGREGGRRDAVIVMRMIRETFITPCPTCPTCPRWRCVLCVVWTVWFVV